MKVYQLKQKVYHLTSTKTTKELKSKKPELTKDKDLRFKNSWIAIYSTFKVIDDFRLELTSKEVSAKHGFKILDQNSSFDELLHNVRALGSFYNSLESKITDLEKETGAN